jgi:hypothetical protein
LKDASASSVTDSKSSYNIHDQKDKSQDNKSMKSGFSKATGAKSKKSTLRKQAADDKVS